MPAITQATARKSISALENLTAIHEALLDTRKPVESSGQLDLGEQVSSEA